MKALEPVWSQKQLRMYPIQASIDASKQSKQALEDFRDEIEGWPVTDLGWPPLKTTLFKKVRLFEEALTEIDSYRSIIDRYKAEAALSKQNVQRQTRGARMSFVDVFDEGDANVYGCVKKVAGELLFRRVEEEKDVIVSSSYTPIEITKELMDDTSLFERPRLVSPEAVAGDAATYYHHECSRLLTATTAAVETKSAACLVGMNRAKPVHMFGNCLIEDTSFQWYDKDHLLQRADSARNVKLVIQVLRVRQVKAAIADFPWRMHACFLHIFAGTAIVVFISPEKLLEYPRIESWLGDASTGALAKAPQMLLPAGYSAWVPYGWLPVPFDADKKRAPKVDAEAVASETITYGLSLSYSPSDIGKNLDVDLSVKALMVQAQPYFFRNLKINSDIATWRSLLCPEEFDATDDAKDGSVTGESVVRAEEGA